MALLQKLLQEVNESDIESVLSVEDQASPETTMQLSYTDDDSTSLEHEPKNSSSLESDTEFPAVNSLEEW
ncbi:hypothetical protein LguiB_013429 [Lonicera macranthoides]